MAQTKKKPAATKKTGDKKSTQTKKSNSRGRATQKSLFDTNHKMLACIIAIFFAVFMGAVVFIEAGSVWGILREFFFGVFGINAFVLPFFIIFVSIVSAIHKDTRHYKQRVTEIFFVYLLVISLCHVIVTDSALTYSEQISEAYNVYKDYAGNGLHYGFGVFGALFGSLPLLMTAGNKLAAGVIVVLVLLALVLFFFGTNIIKFIVSLKKPAEAVSEYAEEKIEDMRTASEDLQEIRARNAEKRRKSARKREIDLDVPVDVEKTTDKGVDPIIETETEQFSDDEEITLLGEFEESEPIDAPSLDELFATKVPSSITTPETEPETYPSLAEIRGDTIVIDTGDDEPETTVVPESSYVAVEETPEEVFAEEPEAEEVVEETVPVEVPVKPYELPPIDCLDKPKATGKGNNAAELREKGETIVKTLKSFGVGTKIVEICQSPSVTRFELQPEPGVKISRITALADDIAMNLAASGVRIEAPIPNKNAVGIEVPNTETTMVTLREIIESSNYRGSKSKLNVALGRDIQGGETCADLAKMPHLLVAGTTGSGKSVCLNTMIVSLLFNATPDDVKLIMIDPKKVEFTVYRSIPHLLVPVVADPRKAAGALSWAVAEMDKRYALFADTGVRNLQGYNNYALSEGLPKMPQIVIIIDELSDLMMAASNEVEDSICRLAQKARAAGMHLIVATQRPSVDVITGLIKANIPSRIAFAVKSQIDSRTIIDTQGAEKLLGNSDMLFCPVGLSKPVRVQGAYVSDDEIERVIAHVTSQGKAVYDDAVMHEIEVKAAQDGKKKSGGVDTDEVPTSDYDDEMFPRAVEVVLEAGMASTTLLQRKLKLGYARAARIVDELADKGIIGPYEGCKPRKILITKEQWYQMQATSSSTAPKQLSIDDLPAVANTDSVAGDSAPTASSEPNYFGSATGNQNYDVEE